MLKHRQALSDLLFQSGQLALEMGGSGVRIKGDGSSVTEADHACEALLVQGLSVLFPSHGIVSEEGHVREAEPGQLVWQVDPIDGTQAFIEGLAHWGPSIGALDSRGPVMGASHYPRLGETWFFALGQGAFRDGQRLPMLVDHPPNRDSAALLPSRWFRWFELDWPGRVRNLGSISAHLAMVASGGVSAAFIPAGWKKWDVAAGLGLLAEVGARATPLSGEAFVSPLDAVASRGQPFVVGSPLAAERLKAGLRFRGSRT